MEGDMMWATQGEPQNVKNPYYNSEMEYNNLQNQQLDFQYFNGETYSFNQTGSNSKMYPEMFTPNATDYYNANGEEDEFANEPPLLEELEIYPDRIMEKTLAVLNPFRSYSLADDAEFLVKDTDLAGPIGFCITLACCLLLSGKTSHFGYIYGQTMVSCVFMYFLLTVMTVKSGVFTLSITASILGYCLLPLVGLSLLGIFTTLNTFIGISLGFIAVLWSSLSASRLFVAISNDYEQRPLIAYPCAIVYGLFCLMVLF